MIAVITGASGMIGTALTGCLLEAGHEVIAVVRTGAALRERFPSCAGLKIMECALHEYADYNTDIKADVFFHLAWDKTTAEGREDARVQANNIQYTLDAVGLADRMGCKVFVGAGSQAEYGTVSEPLKADTPCNPRSCYGIAKYTAGKLSHALCAKLGIRHSWARILSVYGEYDSPNSLVMYLVRTLLEGGTPELTKCEQIWDYMYCGDTARALLSLAESGHDGKAYPVGGGKGRALAEYVEEIREYINRNAFVDYGKKAYYPHQPMYLVADMSDIRKDTGFRAVTDFGEGIARTVRWLERIE